MFYSHRSQKTELIITHWTNKEVKSEDRDGVPTAANSLPITRGSLLLDQLLKEVFSTVQVTDNKSTPFRFLLEKYLGHDELASLMRDVKEKGHLLPPEERQRQAALLAEALGNLMVDGDESDN